MFKLNRDMKCPMCSEPVRVKATVDLFESDESVVVIPNFGKYALINAFRFRLGPYKCPNCKKDVYFYIAVDRDAFKE